VASRFCGGRYLAKAVSPGVIVSPGMIDRIPGTILS
jgi:hypothetical protein